ncbi:unnamed protein product [Haemonchus placei]|uniref:Uncharacterized protein n=1 Tax=Haemonchus placei TaxID=6290 RepID=A0A0N4X0H9_HAEPC|nr:unnamed protein product [Haemonchus placei]
MRFELRVWAILAHQYDLPHYVLDSAALFSNLYLCHGRAYRSPRRRFRSCTAELRRSENTISSFLPELEIQVVHFFDQSQSLPPFFRALDHSYRISTVRKPAITMDSHNAVQSEPNSESVEVSPSITIEEIDRPSTRCDGSIADIPYVDDSDFGVSPRPVLETQSQSEFSL